MKQKIKLAFSDFWGGFEYNPVGKTDYDNILYKTLSEHFDVEISSTPDYLIYSVFGNGHYNYNCKKIFYTGENKRPDLNYANYSLSFDYTNSTKNLRFPLSTITLFEHNINGNFIKNIEPNKIKSEKTKFCNFVFSNPNAPERNYLLSLLNQYKHVDSGGRAFNNIGYSVPNKMVFINNYKFTIAYENSERDGYTTEKIIQPKIVNSIPIYWGNPKVHLDWNPKAFINRYDFQNVEEMVKYIIEVDNNDDLYLKILNESHYHNSVQPETTKKETLFSFFEKIINNQI
jgi:hypothetical protein